MKISESLLEAGKSIRGGWNRKQMDILGVDWPAERGWRKKTIGKEITPEDAEKFLDLRGDVQRKQFGRSPVKNVLPFPQGFPAKDETAIASFHVYLTRLDREVLREALPVLAYVMKSASKRINQTNQ
jgi:hypothetical protein